MAEEMKKYITKYEKILDSLFIRDKEEKHDCANCITEPAYYRVLGWDLCPHCAVVCMYTEIKELKKGK